MKTNILKPWLAAGFAALSIASYAQNLDPTVVVNRAYEGKLLEVHKPQIEMAVPDSVQQFNLDFDYEDLRKNYYFNETCQESVPQAIFCFLIAA